MWVVCEKVVGIFAFLPRTRVFAGFVGRSAPLAGFCSQVSFRVEHPLAARGTRFGCVVHMMNMKKEPLILSFFFF